MTGCSDGSPRSGAVVVADFLPLARTRCGIASGAPIAFAGFSMGGYGSLLLASELGPERVFGVAATSAALWTDPGLSAEGAFDDREDFLAHDVFARRDALSGIPIRLDCGRDDPFADANRAFADAVPEVELTIDAGGHDGTYWREHAGVQFDWLRARLDERG